MIASGGTGSVDAGCSPAGRLVWITGASSGIGTALALQCTRHGARGLILSGRSPERLEAVAEQCRRHGTAVRTLPFDAARPAERADALETLGSFVEIPDILVNNAGISQRSLALETGFSVDRDIMEVNYLAAVELTKAVLPAMVERGFGCIVVVSSVAGLIPTPLRSAYNAAKAAQIAFFGTLANELVGTGVRVMTVIPGFVRTNISINALDGTGSNWGRMDPNQADGISPETAAADILHGMARGRSIIKTGFSPRLKFALLLHRLAPVMLDRVLQKAKVT